MNVVDTDVKLPEPVRHLVLKLAIGLILIAGAGALALRLSLTGAIPNVPEPFDPEAVINRSIPDDQNGTLLYQQARAMLGGSPDVFHLISSSRGGRWSDVSPEVQAWVIKNRPALLVWRSGTDRPEAPYYDLRRIGIGTSLQMLNELGPWCRFAGLEASRLEDVGDLAGAWDWHKARLRAPLQLTKRGLTTEKIISAQYWADAAGRVVLWAEDSKITQALLRRAINDLEAMEPLLGKPSDSLKSEYLLIMGMLSDPTGLYRSMEPLRKITTGGGPVVPVTRIELPEPFPLLQRRVELFVAGEPDRSKRIARLVFTNWLAQADKRPADREKIISVDPLVFESEPAVASPGIASAELARLIETAPLYNLVRGGVSQPASLFPRIDEWPKTLRNARRRRADLIVALAGRLQELETDKLPDSVEELIGQTLPKLPEDYVPPDAGDEASPK